MVPNSRAILLAAGAITGWLPLVAFPGIDAGQDARAQAIQRGKVVYEQNCAGCHGAEGRGDGPAATHLYPKPRDFSAGVFRITSTSGSGLPSDADLLRTITRGVPGSAMPGWELLSEADRSDLVAFVQSITGFYDLEEKKFFSFYEQAGELKALEVPPEPPSTPESIARGKLVFRRAECWKCHGDEGRGDGPSAPTLRDQAGYPIPARDYTSGVFKGGSEPTELFKRVTLGMPGTPMPSHEQVLTPAERWDVVHFVLSMARPGAQQMAEQRRRNVVARRVKPAEGWHDPSSDLWNSVDPTYVALMPLWWRSKRVEGLLIRAAADGERIYVNLQWEDPSENSSAVRPQDFRDAVAVQWARTATAPFIAMGAGVEDVNIWMWKADKEVEGRERPDVHTVYPNMDIMAYPEVEGWRPGEDENVKRALAEMGPRGALGWQAGNPVSEPRPQSSAENLAARGFSTLRALPTVSTKVRGKGAWSKGVWRVVLSRELNAAGTQEAPIALGTHIPFAFAVWDGSAADRNGQKSITIWHNLEIPR